MRNMQLTLGLPEGLKTKLITGQADWDELFNGFVSMRAVSYVTSPDLLMRFIDSGYAQIEILVGENLATSYKASLKDKIEVVERLVDLVNDGTMTIYFSKRTIHSKFYLLENDRCCRVIVGSPNLSLTARDAKRQINYVIYLDLPRQSAYVKMFESDFQTHLKRCRKIKFMEDLLGLFETDKITPRQIIIEKWLAVPEEINLSDQELKVVIREASKQAVDNVKDDVLVVPDLPLLNAHRKKKLEPWGLTNPKAPASKSTFRRRIERITGFPLLVVDRQAQTLKLGLPDIVQNLSEPIPSPDVINQSLADIEKYIETFDLAKPQDPRRVKMNVFEILLYLFAAPFAHEHQKFLTTNFSSQNRGMKYLFLYGPSWNGKTTCVRVILKLMTGVLMKLLDRRTSPFNMALVENVKTIGTCFPLVYDDFKGAASDQDIIKGYWEKWWSPDFPQPQIVFISNNKPSQKWMQSRIKQIDLDVHFTDAARNRTIVEKFFRCENNLYKWFTSLYFEFLDKYQIDFIRTNMESYRSDDLYLARKVMQHLYHLADRSLPDYFPTDDVNRIYDPGRLEWQQLYDLGKIKEERHNGEIRIKFSSDLTGIEVERYAGHLALEIPRKRIGTTIIIQNPIIYDKWLQRENGSWWKKLGRLIPFSRKGNPEVRSP